MPVELRPYQLEANRRFFAGVDNRDFTRGLLVQATGTGKTVGAAKILHTHRRRQKAKGDTRPAVFLAHRTELVEQAFKTFKGLMKYLDIQIEQAGQKAGPTADLVIASVQTVGGTKKADGSYQNYKRIPWLEDRGGCSLLIVDEVHHATAGNYMRFAERCGVFDEDKDCLTLGVTATPQRMDKKSLCREDGTSLLEQEFFSYGLVQAIRDGYLCPLRGKIIVTNADLSKVGTRGGDYIPEALAAAIDNEERTEVAYKHWKEETNDGERLTVGFCASVAHAQHSASYWERQGSKSEYVSGESSVADRRRILDDWRTGRIRTVFNCGVLTEGFDLPAISCVLCLRPTKSGALYAQCVGRGTRTFDGDEFHPAKLDCLVLDCTDNALNHRLDEGRNGSNNQTLASLAGLPDGLDLEGVDLLEAKGMWDKAEEEGRDTSKVKSLSGMKTAAKLIDLLGEAQVAPEVKRNSKLSWAKVGGGYLITAPPVTSGGGERVARLTTDTLGNWNLKVDGVDNIKVAGKRSGEPEFASADTAILTLWPGTQNLLSVGSPWKQKGASDKQIAALARLGLPKEQLASMTMGEAGTLINKLRQGGVRGAWGAFKGMQKR